MKSTGPIFKWGVILITWRIGYSLVVSVMTAWGTWHILSYCLSTCWETVGKTLILNGGRILRINVSSTAKWQYICKNDTVVLPGTHMSPENTDNRIKNDIWIMVSCRPKHQQCHVLGLYSLSGQTSYYKISWCLEVARFVFRLFQLLWNLTGHSAAALPMCLSNFRAVR